MEEMPVIDTSINQARLSLLQRVESDRISPRRLYWEAQGIWDVNLEHDILRDVYAKLETVTSQDLVGFHEQYVKGRQYNIMVMGDRAVTPLSVLEQYGAVQELSMEELFGY
jgi:hypothetical protein